MQPSPTPASPVVQTLDHEDDEHIAENQPMPPQPLLPARRLRAMSATDPVPAAAEAPAVEAPTKVVLVPPAINTPAEGAAVPAAK